MSRAGASLIRVNVSWIGTAPRERPPGFDPADPTDPAYRFAPLDATVRALTARGFKLVFNVAMAPSWAEGPDRDPAFRAGTWKPDPAEFGAFARALAARYSGTFPDPLIRGATLPRVSRWQAWNEPNLSLYLAPQWERRNGRWTPASPDRYRTMLNAFYEGIKGVNRSNRVITAGTAPFGDPEPGDERMRPVEFWREVFCLQGARALSVAPCPDRTRFDVFAHHPITPLAPEFTARFEDNVTTADLRKLTRVLRRAERVGRAAPAGRKPLWATELWWDSSPPNPDGVPEARHAAWAQEALYRLWSQGVKAAVWLLLQDSPSASFAPASHSGLLFGDGRPKRAYRAFRFPFVTDQLGGTRPDGRRQPARAWGKAPRSGAVRIQRRAGRRWRTIARPRARAGGIFWTTVRLKAGDRVRALGGRDRSLIWRHRGRLAAHPPPSS